MSRIDENKKAREYRAALRLRSGYDQIGDQQAKGLPMQW